MEGRGERIRGGEKERNGKQEMEKSVQEMREMKLG